jgi:hypothetical protein
LGSATGGFNQASERLSFLQDSIDRHFKSTAPQIGRNPLQILGFSELTNDLTGQHWKEPLKQF